MNRLIIIGNGFDLSLGLKSSYKDFLFYYLKKTVKEYFESDTYKRTENIEEDSSSNHYSDGLIKLSIPVIIKKDDLLPEIDKYENYNDLSEYLKNKHYLKFPFLLLRELDKRLSLNNWIDVEILYYDLLVKMTKSITDIDAKEKYIENYNSNFNKLRIELINYLKQLKLPWDEDGQKHRYSDSVITYIREFFDKIILMNTLIPWSKDRLMILNFNYTNTVKSLLSWEQLDKRNYNINHIHGNIDKDIDSVIFGFGDELDKDYLMLESDRSKGLFSFIKSPHYFQQSNYRELNNFLSKDSYEVYILGHSCGISDRTLFNEIFETDSCKRIRMFYHERENLSNNKLESSIELTKHFKDKIKMRKKVKNFDKGDKMFQIKRLEPLPKKTEK